MSCIEADIGGISIFALRIGRVVVLGAETGRSEVSAIANGKSVVVAYDMWRQQSLPVEAVERRREQAAAGWQKRAEEKEMEDEQWARRTRRGREAVEVEATRNNNEEVGVVDRAEGPLARSAEGRRTCRHRRRCRRRDGNVMGRGGRLAADRRRWAGHVDRRRWRRQ